MKKILISAYACRPTMGSEPRVGWEFIRRISNDYKIIVIVRAKYRDTILKESFDFEHSENIDFIFHDVKLLMNLFKKGHVGLWIYYYLWHLTSIPKVLRADKIHKIDLVHHLTMVNDWLPSVLWILNKPFIWGPVGGYSFTMGKRFFFHLRFKSMLKESFRIIIQTIFFYLEPISLFTKYKADVILISSNNSKLKLKRFTQNLVFVPHIFIPEVQFQYTKRTNERFTVFTTGRIVYWKGLDLAIKAFSKFNRLYPESELLIGGKGPEKNYYEDIVKKTGNSCIKFVEYEEERNLFYKRYINCDVFIQPTLRDGPLATILEAMYFAKPVITLDIPSFKELIPDYLGFKVKYDTFENIIDSIKDKIIMYYNNPTYTNEIGLRGREFVLREYSGEVFLNNIKVIYEELA